MRRTAALPGRARPTLGLRRCAMCVGYPPAARANGKDARTEEERSLGLTSRSFFFGRCCAVAAGPGGRARTYQSLVVHSLVATSARARSLLLWLWRSGGGARLATKKDRGGREKRATRPRHANAGGRRPQQARARACSRLGAGAACVGGGGARVFFCFVCCVCVCVKAAPRREGAEGRGVGGGRRNKTRARRHRMLRVHAPITQIPRVAATPHTCSHTRTLDVVRRVRSTVVVRDDRTRAADEELRERARQERAWRLSSSRSSSGAG
jgi:hypothetical protein